MFMGKSKSESGGSSLSSSMRKNGVEGVSSIGTGSSSTSILVLVVDVSPLAWGERDILRSKQDRERLEAGKRTIGPCTLEELLISIQAFAAAFTNLERGAALLILGVADQESALLYPRKDALQQWIDHPESYVPAIQNLPSDLLTGVATLLGTAAQRAASNFQKQQESGESNRVQADQASRQGAMGSAISRALCLLNRIMVATQATGGISALHSTFNLRRSEDEGVVALMGSGAKKKKKNTTKSAWSPRIFIIQASEDRARDYNAMMNCAFCASQQQIVVDACFLTAGGGPSRSASSPFLEQVCDLTNGVYLAPSGAAQVGGALTEVLISVFLPRIDCRPALHLPALNKVDFRARCFETAEMVDLAYVCNQCLSIFAQNPAKLNNTSEPQCPTCQARILTATDKRR